MIVYRRECLRPEKCNITIFKNKQTGLKEIRRAQGYCSPFLGGAQYRLWSMLLK